MSDTDAVRGRVMLEESPEAVLVLDEHGRVVAASRRARTSVQGVREGERLPDALLAGDGGTAPFVVPYDVGGRTERLVYFHDSGDLAAYEELRSGFTAAVSHELRTPLARLLSLLETVLLPGEDLEELIAGARREVEQIGELIDEVLFLSELESGARVVSLGATAILPVLEQVADDLDERAARAGVRLRVEGDPAAAVAVRPRMLQVVAHNLAENAVRYAGQGATLTLSARREDGDVVLAAVDDGAGVQESELPRIFERFYRSDRARASRGTGLGLAIVKHVVTSAGGTVEARGGKGRGLEIRCTFAAGGRSH